MRIDRSKLALLLVLVIGLGGGLLVRFQGRTVCCDAGSPRREASQRRGTVAQWYLPREASGPSATRGHERFDLQPNS